MDYKKYNDYELVYMVRENDDDSMSILFRKYEPVIISIAKEFYERYKNFGHDYEDFYQEALISFQRAIVSYDENKDSLFYTFINMCLRRNLQSFCRNISTNKKNILMSSYVDITDYDIPDERSNIDIAFDYIEFSKIFKNTIYDLPNDVAAIMELKLNGFSYREIETLLDIPSSTAEFKSRKARKLLRSNLHKYYCK